jgi:hypothetical protein
MLQGVAFLVNWTLCSDCREGTRASTRTGTDRLSRQFPPAADSDNVRLTQLVQMSLASGRSRIWKSSSAQLRMSWSSVRSGTGSYQGLSLWTEAVS